MVFRKIVLWGYAAIVGGAGGRGSIPAKREHLPSGAAIVSPPLLQSIITPPKCTGSICPPHCTNYRLAMSGHAAASSSLCGSLNSSTA
jgi:hypothetical protein